MSECVTLLKEVGFVQTGDSSCNFQNMRIAKLCSTYLNTVEKYQSWVFIAHIYTNITQILKIIMQIISQ